MTITRGIGKLLFSNVHDKKHPTCHIFALIKLMMIVIKAGLRLEMFKLKKSFPVFTEICSKHSSAIVTYFEQ